MFQAVDRGAELAQKLIESQHRIDLELLVVLYLPARRGGRRAAPGGGDGGRAQRTIKGPRRRALIARDQHCLWLGCERPASFCEGHHLRHWIRGGGWSRLMTLSSYRSGR